MWPSRSSRALCAETSPSSRARCDEACPASVLGDVHGLDQQGPWGSRAGQAPRARAPASHSSLGGQGARLRLPPVFVPRELHPQQPRGQTAAYQPWPPAEAAGGARRAPLCCCLLSVVLGSGDWSQTPSATDGPPHNTASLVWIPRDGGIRGFCSGPLLAPAHPD